jgi:hypothetical protein
MHMNKTYNHKTKIERIRSIVVYGIFIFRKHYRKLKKYHQFNAIGRYDDHGESYYHHYYVIIYTLFVITY